MEHVLRLGIDEVWCAAEEIDPVDALVGELTGRDTAGQRITVSSTPGGDLVLLDDEDTGRRWALPADALAAMGTAARCVFAACFLLHHAVVTTAVIGSGPTAQFTLNMIAQHVPGVSHAALYAADGAEVEPRTLDLLDLTGIGFVLADSPAKAVLGANLVIAEGPAAAGLRLDHLSPQAVLIKLSGAQVAKELVDRAATSYVDCIGPPDASGTRRGADFGWLLAHRPGLLDDLVLVELRDPRPVNPSLAHRLLRTAEKGGLGTPARLRSDDR